MAPSIKETGAVTPRVSKTAITKGVKKTVTIPKPKLGSGFFIVSRTV